MAKSIILQWEGNISEFGFTKLERAKLYGYKARQIVDSDGKACSSAYLTADGSALIPSGGLAMLYVDENSTTIERSELKAVDGEGGELTKKPSTLSVEQELTGPVSAQELLNHTILNVYQLKPETLNSKLAEQLEAGKIFTSVFSYRGDYELQKLFLLQAEDKTYFALTASPTSFEFLSRDIIPDLEEEEEEDMSDDFDFSMM